MEKYETLVSRTIILDGVVALNVVECYTKYLIINSRQKKPIERKEECYRYELTEISVTDLISKRKSGLPMFLLKQDGKYFYTEIPNDISFLASDILGSHLCGNCARMSPATDAGGGCAKVRNRVGRIERYPWITLGYETINTNVKSMVICNCQHFVAVSDQVKPQVKPRVPLKHVH